MVIYKYPLQITGYQTLSLPKGAKLLSVQMQGATCCLWALVDPEHNIRESRTLRMLCTGESFIKEGDYISTFQIPNQGLVFHVFESPTEEAL